MRQRVATVADRFDGLQRFLIGNAGRIWSDFYDATFVHSISSVVLTRANGRTSIALCLAISPVERGDFDEGDHYLNRCPMLPELRVVAHLATDGLQSCQDMCNSTARRRFLLLTSCARCSLRELDRIAVPLDREASLGLEHPRLDLVGSS